ELELEALQSIYLDDIEVVPQPQLAWAQDPVIAFRVCVRSDDGARRAWLHVSFPPLYPKIPPVIAVEKLEGVRQHVQDRIRAFVRDTPPTMPDAEIGHAIIDDVKTVFLDGDGCGVDDAAPAQAVASLDAERLAQEAERRRAAEQRAQEEERRQLRLRSAAQAAQAAHESAQAAAAQELLDSITAEAQRAQERERERPSRGWIGPEATVLYLSLDLSQTPRQLPIA
ncbi:hypothetical protein KEM52_003560, partial [Ascosphaera acerosa]